MKKILFVITMTILSMINVSAQFKGEIETYKMNDLTVHAYTSFEAMGDISIIIEGKKELVVLEQQSFYQSIEDFNNYIKSLKKPIVKVVADYHTGGLAQWDNQLTVMVEGMPDFEKGPVYSGMIAHFAKVFDGAMDTRAHQATKTVSFNSTQNWAGIDFMFENGAANDFPAASININNKVYYSHFAPAFAHLNAMQLNSKESVDALLRALSKAKESGCTLFVGSHGKPARIDAIEFQLQYLNTIKETLHEAKSKEEFIQKITQSFVGLPGVENVTTVADILYK